MGLPSLVVPLMPIQLQQGAAVDCGLGEARGEAGGVARGEAPPGGAAHAGDAEDAGDARRALDQCLAAVRRATAQR